MLYYEQMLNGYDVDNFTMPLAVNTMTILFQFSWPVTVQKLYDDQLLVLNSTFRSQSFYLPTDPENPLHLGYSQALVEQWLDFVTAWDGGSDTTDIINNTPWPSVMKAAVQATLGNSSLPDLRNSISLILDSLRPTLAYMEELDAELLWRVTMQYGTEVRELCLNKGCVHFQNEKDWRLLFSSSQERITRDNLGEVNLIIIIGDGDI